MIRCNLVTASGQQMGEHDFAACPRIDEVIAIPPAADGQNPTFFSVRRVQHQAAGHDKPPLVYLIVEALA